MPLIFPPPSCITQLPTHTPEQLHPLTHTPQSIPGSSCCGHSLDRCPAVTSPGGLSQTPSKKPHLSSTVLESPPPAIASWSPLPGLLPKALLLFTLDGWPPTSILCPPLPSATYVIATASLPLVTRMPLPGSQLSENSLAAVNEILAHHVTPQTFCITRIPNPRSPRISFLFAS